MAPPPPRPPSPPAPQLHRDVLAQRARDILSLLLVFRVANACVVATFFQPDEYYQALEPAWAIAFGDIGKESGPWLTWEWKHALRSSLLPYAISLLYHFGTLISTVLFLPHPLRAHLYIFLPNIFTGCITAAGEFATWRLSERIYGVDSKESWVLVLMTLLNPWLFFTGTRTLSNTIEAGMTSIALACWPWSLLSSTSSPTARARELHSLRWAILLAATAVLLRPTNALIWAVLTLWTLWSASRNEMISFMRTASTYGIAVLSISIGLDHRYYGRLVFPPIEFLRYNLQQNLAVFYGTNRADYYFTEGLPLLLTSFLPFALLGLYRALAGTSIHRAILRPLSLTTLSSILALSSIAHKEVRFLAPLLAPLHLLAAAPLATYLVPPSPPSRLKRLLIWTVAALEIALALFASIAHQRGPLALTSHLRALHETRNRAFFAGATHAVEHPTTVGLLMPCHSTPWRSHLYYRGVHAWALTCEPPLGLSAAGRARYVDEADVFYGDPVAWLVAAPRAWPQHLGMFESLVARGAGGRSGAEVRAALSGLGYGECWRGFGSWVHEDWRRRGDVVVWCREEEGDVD